jgi:hypothetical protein
VLHSIPNASYILPIDGEFLREDVLTRELYEFMDFKIWELRLCADVVVLYNAAYHSQGKKVSLRGVG